LLKEYNDGIHLLLVTTAGSSNSLSIGAVESCKRGKREREREVVNNGAKTKIETDTIKQSRERE
jgi:hypothetical protein